MYQITDGLRIEYGHLDFVHLDQVILATVSRPKLELTLMAGNVVELFIARVRIHLGTVSFMAWDQLSSSSHAMGSPGSHSLARLSR